MVKTFVPRVSKRERQTLDLADRLSGKDIFRQSDEKLLRGARLDEIKMADINVKDQVRTKFNDDSIHELAENIKINGLIQPLVIHLKDGKYTLICGERRFRAITSLGWEKASCFILDSKSEEELMAIQFSENSSREQLHYIDTADGIYNYQLATNASERKIQAALGISKSEVHRSLILAKLSKEMKESAKKYDIEKYVLLEWEELEESSFKEELQMKITDGTLTKRSQLKRRLREQRVAQESVNTLAIPQMTVEENRPQLQ